TKKSPAASCRQASRLFHRAIALLSDCVIGSGSRYPGITAGIPAIQRDPAFIGLKLQPEPAASVQPRRDPARHF
ncbi:hypothetical protein P4H83_33300, partial [Paenibacillus favisporus]|uniref:hypothetical protein n=1 Tax=Paenibacillus favisporus TaxID=221028 RepID=UPI002DB89C14